MIAHGKALARKLGQEPRQPVEGRSQLGT
jgi:hypothetical protein